MKKMLEDYFPDYQIDVDNDDFHAVRIYGKTYLYELNLCADVPDSECSRVKICGEYYYFGLC